MPAFLEIVSGTSKPGQKFELASGRMVVGRHPDCAIVLDNIAVARKHADIVEVDGMYSIEDLRSRCGICVNGRRFPTQTLIALTPGGLIRIANVELRFHGAGPSR